MTPTQTKRTFCFGEKLRQVRERKGYTLKVVAQQAGVSESLISQIERNKVSPAIDTLLSIADVLDIRLEYLFDEYRAARPVKVITADERRTTVESDVTYEEVAQPCESDGTHAVESYIISIPAKSITHRGSYGHPGREFGFIMEGKGALHYENDVYQLNTGDSVSFAASAPHTLENVGDTVLRAMWVVSPPQRFLNE